MCEKIFISFLLVAIFNLLVGCYSSELITVPEYNRIEDKDKPDDIRFTTKDYKEYHFSDSNFYVENDTLYGTEILLLSEGEFSFEGKFSISEIDNIQILAPDNSYSIRFSPSQYLKTETASGKPDEIYLTKIDSTRYYFLKNNFYIEDDTFFGKGKLLLSDREELLDRETTLSHIIALSDIVSIEVENFNFANTFWLGLGIVAALALIAAVVLSIGFAGAK